MTLVSVAARNALRNRFRTFMTVLGGAVAVLAFILLRTVLQAWHSGIDHAAKDRLATRHKISFVIPLPKRYIDDIRQVPGVKVATYSSWFGAKWPKDPNEFFATLAVADNLFDVYPEISIPPDQMTAWREDRKGAVIGDVLAKKLKLKVGDRIVLTGTIYPGDWEMNIDAVYTAPPQAAVDRSTLYFHWDYLNDAANPRQKNYIGWIVTRVDDPSKSAEISGAIDRLFDDRDTQTATMSERSMFNGFLGGVSAILSLLNVVSVIILVIMMLILGNTIAMGVRERTTEYGVLRAVGFQPGHIRLFIVGEAVTVSLFSALAGCALAFPLIQGGMGKWLEENMAQYFPSFRLDPLTLLAATGLTLALGALAALVPALQAGRLQVTDALRRIA